MTCAERMEKHVPACVPHQRLQDALEIMGEDDMGWVAIIESHDDRSFLGWITAQEAAVFLGAFDRRPSEIMCRELITAPPAVLNPATSLEEAYATLRRLGRKSLPVVDAGQLVGSLKLGDEARATE